MTNEEAIQEILDLERKLYPIESTMQRLRDDIAFDLGVTRLFRPRSPSKALDPQDDPT